MRSIAGTVFSKDLYHLFIISLVGVSDWWLYEFVLAVFVVLVTPELCVISSADFSRTTFFTVVDSFTSESIALFYSGL